MMIEYRQQAVAAALMYVVGKPIDKQAQAFNRVKLQGQVGKCLAMQAGDVIVQIADLSLADAASPMRGLTSYMKGVAVIDEVQVEFVCDG